MNQRLPLVCFLVFLLSPALYSGQEAAPKRKPLSPQKWTKLHEGDIVFIRSRTANAPLIAALSGVAEDDADDVSCRTAKDPQRIAKIESHFEPQ